MNMPKNKYMEKYTSCPIEKKVLSILNMHKAVYGIKTHSRAIEQGLKAYAWIKLNHPEVDLK